MANTITCLQYGCEQPPIVDVHVTYLFHDEKKDSRASYCLDHVAERVWSMLAVGKATMISIQKLDAAVVVA